MWSNPLQDDNFNDDLLVREHSTTWTPLQLLYGCTLSNTSLILMRAATDISTTARGLSDDALLLRAGEPYFAAHFHDDCKENNEKANKVLSSGTGINKISVDVACFLSSRS